MKPWILVRLLRFGLGIVKVKTNMIKTSYLTRLNFLKFIYSEMATKFLRNLHLFLTVTSTSQKKVEISQNFVAFSEYMNFKRRYCLNFFCCFEHTFMLKLEQDCAFMGTYVLWIFKVERFFFFQLESAHKWERLNRGSLARVMYVRLPIYLTPFRIRILNLALKFIEVLILTDHEILATFLIGHLRS